MAETQQVQQRSREEIESDYADRQGLISSLGSRCLMQDIVWRRQHYHNQRVRLIEAITDSNFVEIDIYHIRNSAVRVTTPRRLSEAKYEIFVGDDSVQDIERDFIYLVNEAIHRIMIQENK